MLKLTREKRERLKTEFAPVANDPAETTRRTLAWASFFFGDPEYPAHFYLRTGDIPKVHWGIHFSLSLNYKFYYCTSPREHAKTTHLRCNTLYRLYYKMEPYILLIGKVGDSGKSLLSNLKFDVEQNEKLLEVYGELKPKRREVVWSAHEIETTNGCYLRSIGMMGSVRSGQKKGWRYTMILGDDVQDSTDMREPSTLETHKSFWEREVEYAIDSGYGKIRYIGNLLGRGCLLDFIMQDKKYQGTSFHSLVKEDGTPDMLDNPREITGKSIWPAYHSTEKLRGEALDAIIKGKRAIWLAERQNIIVDELSRALTGYRFHHATFHRHADAQNVLVSDEWSDPIPVHTYLGIDPAFAQDKNADERVLLVFAKGRTFKRVENTGEMIAVNTTWILEYIYNHMNPTKIIDVALEWHKKYFFSSVIIEAIGGALIYESMFREKVVGDSFYSQHPFAPIFVKHQEADKKSRIYNSLQPKMALGQIYIRPEHQEFQNECAMFDSIKSPHILDTLQFSNEHSTECTESLYRAVSKYDHRKIEIQREIDNNWRNWSVQNLSQLGIS
jgi:hypothetical protein